MTTIIITENITLDCEIDKNVDPMIIINMKERLNPTKTFSYANGDHLKGAEENEKRMRGLK